MLATKLGSVPAKWYFSRKDGTLLGVEVQLLEREKDPCEVYFSDYKKVGERAARTDRGALRQGTLRPDQCDEV